MRLSNPFRKCSSPARSKARRLDFQSLEPRHLLAGLVMEESMFSVTQFRNNIVEQVPVDIVGPNGVVGYSYAIIDGDLANPLDNPIAGARGAAVLPWDNPAGNFPLPASPDRPHESASPAKLITGASIMLLLQEQNPGLNYADLQDALQIELNRPIVNYLPQPWAAAGWAPNFANITVGELLTHSSGLRSDAGWVTTSTLPGGGFSGGGNVYNYSGLQQISQFGSVDPSKPSAYWTNNFAWFRVMLPYMWNLVDNVALDFNANQNLLLTRFGTNPVVGPYIASPGLEGALVGAMIEDWGGQVAPNGFNGIMSITPDRVVASIYKYYVSEYLLKPAGVDDPQSKTSGPSPTLLYPLWPTIVPGTEVWPNPAPGPPTPAQVPGFDTGDRTLELGSRGWQLSAPDLARPFWAVRNGVNGTPLFEAATLDLMDAQGLGWQHSTTAGLVGDFGQYWGHNGINFRPLNPTAISLGNPNVPAGASLGSMNNTVAIAFPNGVAAALMFNSQIQSVDGPTPPPLPDWRSQIVIGGAFNVNSPAPNGPTAVGTGTNATLINAYDNAWTELVYDGNSLVDVVSDPSLISPNDRFIIQTNPTNPAYIDIQHWADTIPGTNPLTTITRRADTLTKLTINGSGGADTYFIQALPADLEVIINGDHGSSTVVVGGPTAGPFNLDNTPGTLTFNGGAGFNLLRIDDTNNTVGTFYEVTDDAVTRTGAGTYNYHNVDTLLLNTSDEDDTIIVLGTAADIGTQINTGRGADDVQVGIGVSNIGGPINVQGGPSSGATPDIDTLQLLTGILSSAPREYVVDSDEVTIDGSPSITFNNVEELILSAGGGDDVVTVNSLNADQSLGIYTNHGADTVKINLLSSPLVTSVLGRVYVDGGTGTDDTLTINDETHFESSEYIITDSSVDREHIQPIGYDGIENLHVIGGVSPSNYDIQSTSTPTTVTGGIQSDTFHVGTNVFGDPDLNVINGLLRIEGGDNVAGEDTVFLNDSLGSNGAYVIDDEMVTGNNFAPITLVDVHHGILNTSNLGVVVHLENAAGDTRYTVNGGFGNNTYHLAFGSQNLSTFDNPLIINGGVNDDDLVLYDQNAFGNPNYDVTANSVDRPFFGERDLFNSAIGVTFSAMTSVELHMNDRNSNVDVESTAPTTKYLLHGNDGNDTLNLNRHLDDDVDPVVDIDGVAVTSEAMIIQHDGFEQLNLNLGDEPNTVRIHRLHSPAAVNLGLGDDHVFVTPDSQDLSFIQFPIVVNGQGGTDSLHLLDGNYGADAQYTVTENTVDRPLFGTLIDPGVTYFDLDVVHLFMASGDDVVDINSTAPATEYHVDGGPGDDTFYVNLSPTSRLTLFGNVGEDHAVITGTEGDDEVSISAGFGTADINMPDIEMAAFDGLGGTDVLVAEGVGGTSEQFEVEASTTAGAGELRIITTLPGGNNLINLAFENTEFLDLLANPTSPGEMDTATFIGTDLGDQLEVFLRAEGTNADPVLQFFEPGGNSPLLSLRDYRNFGTLAIEGLDGPDRFNVYVAPTGPGIGHRDLWIDGGSPTGGPPLLGDRLRLYSAVPPAGNPVQHDPGDPGQIRVDYGPLHQFTIDYVDIEWARVVKNFWVFPASTSSVETPSSGSTPTLRTVDGVLAPPDAATPLDQAIVRIALAREAAISAMGDEATRCALSDWRSTCVRPPLQAATSEATRPPTAASVDRDVSARRAAARDFAFEGNVNFDRLAIAWPGI